MRNFLKPTANLAPATSSSGIDCVRAMILDCAVKVLTAPAQIVVLPAMDTSGNAFTVIVPVALKAIHPPVKGIL